MAEDAAVWPPPVTEETVWERRRVGLKVARSVPMRQVWLWGEQVWIDEAGDVFCGCCWECVSVSVLGVPGNKHAASPWPGRGNGVWSRVTGRGEPATATELDPSRVEF